MNDVEIANKFVCGDKSGGYRYMITVMTPCTRTPSLLIVHVADAERTSCNQTDKSQTE